MRRSGAASRNRFCVASRRDVVREAKERFCSVAERVSVTGKPIVAFSQNSLNAFFKMAKITICQKFTKELQDCVLTMIKYRLHA